MQQILALAQKIRDCVDNNNLYDKYFKTHLDEWFAYCVAIDTLEDSSLALEYYETSGIGDKAGEKYLKLYGLLQAVFLQQDSIRQLHKTFIGNDLQPNRNTPWMRIRNLRHLTVGHPIDCDKNKSKTKRCFISRVTIHCGGFTLLVWDEDKGKDEFKNVDLKSLYESYKSQAVKYLRNSYETAQIKKWGALQKH